MTRDVRPVDRLVLRLRNALIMSELSRGEVTKPLAALVRDALEMFEADERDAAAGDEFERKLREAECPMF